MPPKRSRPAETPLAVATEDPITFRVTDSTGHQERLALNKDTVASIPYLETMLNTAVGDRDSNGVHELSLPDGCSANLFASLTTYQEALLSSGLNAWKPAWDVASIQNAVELVRTADFLRLESLFPTLVGLCRATIKCKEDAQVFTSMAELTPHPEIQRLLDELRGNAVSNEMTFEDVKATISGYGLLECQADTVAAFMKHEHRTDTEWNEFLDLLRAPTDRVNGHKSLLWSLASSESVTSWGTHVKKYTFFVRDGSAYLVTQLARIASEREHLFMPIYTGIFCSVHKVMMLTTGLGSLPSD
eukprot:7390120-Prymnesium_polylepis.1